MDDQTELLFFWSIISEVPCSWQQCCSLLPSISLKTASESSQSQTCVRYAALNSNNFKVASFCILKCLIAFLKKAIQSANVAIWMKRINRMINRSIVLVIFAILKYYFASQLTWKCFRTHWRRMKWGGKWGLPNKHQKIDELKIQYNCMQLL